MPRLPIGGNRKLAAAVPPRRSDDRALAAAFTRSRDHGDASRRLARWPAEGGRRRKPARIADAAVGSDGRACGTEHQHEQGRGHARSLPYRFTKFCLQRRTSGFSCSRCGYSRSGLRGPSEYRDKLFLATPVLLHGGIAELTDSSRSPYKKNGPPFPCGWPFCFLGLPPWFTRCRASRSGGFRGLFRARTWVAFRIRPRIPASTAGATP